MASVENFFKSDKPHGLVKRLILKKYLQAYIRIMLPGNKPKNKVRIVDGFAGTGRYEEYGWPEEIEKYGSPIIALHVAIQHLLKLEFKPPVDEHKGEINTKYDQMLADLHRTTMEPLNFCTENQALSLIYVEDDEKYYKALFKNVIQTLLIYGLKPRIWPNFRNGICIIRVDHPATSEELPFKYRIATSFYRIAISLFCAEFKQLRAPPSPSFAFIDPCGFSYTPFDKVSEFVGVRKEVFINLITRDINRFISVKLEQVGDLFGIPADELAEWNESVAEAGDKIQQLVDKYQQRLKDANAKYTVNFEMRGPNNARLYHLVFAAYHVKGLKVMKEAMNRGTQETNRFCSSDFQITKKGGKAISFLNDQKDDDVADIMHREFSGQTVPISEVQSFILFSTLYVFRKKPLAILEKAQKMEVVGPNDTQRRANQYPDGTDWMFKFSLYLAAEEGAVGQA